MATEKKYVSLSKLGYYDGKIKAFINAADAATLASAQSYAEGLATSYDAAGSAATVQRNLDKEITRSTTRDDEIAALVDTAQGDVDKLETYVGTIPTGVTATDIVGYIQEKTTGIATNSALGELQSAVDLVEADVATIKGDYLKEADKTELSDAITAEAAAARAAEQANASAIAGVVADYLKAADKTELQGGIDENATAIAGVKEDVDAFLSAAEVGEAAVDTLKEIQTYITADGEAAATMTANIAQNATDIGALEGRMDTAEGKITAIEGQVGDNEIAIANLQTAVGEGGSVDEKIEDAIADETAAREAAVAGVQGNVDALAGKVGTVADDTTVVAMIADAKKAGTDANTALETYKTSNDAALALKADKSELNALSDKVGTVADGSTVVGMIGEANSAIQTVSGELASYKTSNDAAVALKADKTALDAAVARIATNEAEIASFIEISEAEINQLFQQNA